MTQTYAIDMLRDCSQYCSFLIKTLNMTQDPNNQITDDAAWAAADAKLAQSSNNYVSDLT